MIKIGKKEISSNIIMAPMSGCTDLAFRTMVRKHGAKLCFFEMVDASSLIMKNPKTFQILKTNLKDKPIAAQIIGSDPFQILDAAYILIDTVPDIVFLDINSACPVKKILKKKSGAYLMKSSNTLIKIAKTLSYSCKLKLPITVKIRTGYDKNDLPFLIDLVKRLEDNGISAIFIHGRTCRQMYSGKIDYASIRKVKETVSIPVFGSGNIFSPELARKMIIETGCDGITVARGSLGIPWIFKDIEKYLQTGEFATPKNITEKKRNAMSEHIRYIEKYKGCLPGGKGNIGLVKKVMMWYIKGFPDARSIRNKICRIENYNELIALMERDIC